MKRILCKIKVINTTSYSSHCGEYMEITLVDTNEKDIICLKWIPIKYVIKSDRNNPTDGFFEVYKKPQKFDTFTVFIGMGISPERHPKPLSNIIVKRLDMVGWSKKVYYDLDDLYNSGRGYGTIEDKKVRIKTFNKIYDMIPISMRERKYYIRFVQNDPDAKDESHAIPDSYYYGH